MRKLLSTLLVLLMMLSLFGCGNKQEPEQKEPEQKEPEKEEDPKKEEDPTEDPSGETDIKEPEEQKEPDKEEPKQENPTDEEPKQDEPVNKEPEEQKEQEPETPPVVEEPEKEKEEPQPTVSRPDFSRTEEQKQKISNSIESNYIGVYKNRKVYVIKGSSEVGYYINGYIAIPDKVELKHLLVHPKKLGEERSYEMTDKEVLYRVKNVNEWNDKIADNVNGVLLTISIPETNMTDGQRHLALDIPRLIEDDKFGHIDMQVTQLIVDAINFLNDKKGLNLSEKVDLFGYSGEGSFCIRYPLLHPEMVNAVCAGGISWCISMPTDELGGAVLNYPLGIGEIEKYTSDFDMNDWKNIKFYLEMGAKDDRGSYNHEYLGTTAWSKNLTYEEIWNTFAAKFLTLTNNGEVVTYTNLGHNHDPIIQDYSNFFVANDGDKFVVITPVNEATVQTAGKTIKKVDEITSIKLDWKFIENKNGKKRYYVKLIASGLNDSDVYYLVYGKRENGIQGEYTVSKLKKGIYVEYNQSTIDEHNIIEDFVLVKK